MHRLFCDCGEIDAAAVLRYQLELSGILNIAGVKNIFMKAFALGRKRLCILNRRPSYFGCCQKDFIWEKGIIYKVYRGDKDGTNSFYERSKGIIWMSM